MIGWMYAREGEQHLCTCVHTCTNRCDPMTPARIVLSEGLLICDIYPATGFQPQMLGVQRGQVLHLRAGRRHDGE